MSRYRNYGTVVYPTQEFLNELFPDCDYDGSEGFGEFDSTSLNVIRDSHIPTFVSPLHCFDINPDGSIKKPHFHIMVLYDNVKTQEQFNAFRDTFYGVGCEIVQSTRGYARYLCHLDNPEKHQYNIEDVQQLNGADYSSIIGLACDRYKCIKEMLQFCQVNNILFFSDLMDYAMDSRPDWFRLLADNSTYICKEYLNSKLHRLK